MLIQLIIFITKSKLFANEINREGKVETISINGNPEIKYEDNESIDEAVSCIFDFYNIDSFADDNFDIVILEAGTSRKFVKYLEEKCADANRLNIYSMEKILPAIVMNKNLLKQSKEIFVTFSDQFYKIAFADNSILKVEVANTETDAIKLCKQDFFWFYYPVINFKINNERQEENTKINKKEENEIEKPETKEDISNQQKSLKLAADIYRRALILENGYCISQAVALYRKAADLGNADAQFKLGLMYKNGNGVVLNNIQAIEWLRKAALQGHENAKRILNNMLAEYIS